MHNVSSTLQEEQDAAVHYGSVLSLCVVYFFTFCSIFVQHFLVPFPSFFSRFLSLFVRLLHLSRFVWFAQKQIAGSMQMHDAAYQILFESLDLPCQLTAALKGYDWPGGRGRSLEGGIGRCSCTCYSFALQKRVP